MQRGSKRISNHSIGKIQNVKSNIRFSKNPFDGSGYVFKEAIRQLRQEGLNIIYDSKKCRYYNSDTIDVKWGY